MIAELQILLVELVMRLEHPLQAHWVTEGHRMCVEDAELDQLVGSFTQDPLVNLIPCADAFVDAEDHGQHMAEQPVAIRC